MATKHDNTPTPESIAAEQRYQAEERRKVEAATGIRIEDAPCRGAFRIHCPRAGCTYSASARTEARLYRPLAAHLVLAHRSEF